MVRYYPTPESFPEIDTARELSIISHGLEQWEENKIIKIHGDYYRILEKLGERQFEVWHLRNINTGFEIAAKKIKFNKNEFNFSPKRMKQTYKYMEI